MASFLDYSGGQCPWARENAEYEAEQKRLREEELREYYRQKEEERRHKERIHLEEKRKHAEEKRKRAEEEKKLEEEGGKGEEGGKKSVAEGKKPGEGVRRLAEEDQKCQESQDKASNEQEGQNHDSVSIPARRQDHDRQRNEASHNRTVYSDTGDASRPTYHDVKRKEASIRVETAIGQSHERKDERGGGGLCWLPCCCRVRPTSTQ